MIPEWFVLSNNQAIGPYTQVQLKELMHQGSVTAATYVRRLDGPWLTAAQFYSAIAAQNVVPQTAIVHQPVYSSPVSSSALPYRRKRASTAVNVVVFISMVLIGGAAAMFTAKSMLSLAQRPAPIEPEVEVIVIPAPSRPAGSAIVPKVVTVQNRAAPKGQEPRIAMPVPRVAGNVLPTVNSVPKPATSVAKLDSVATAWLEKAEDILERREELQSANDEVERELQRSLDEVGRVESELKGLRSQEMRTQATHEERDRQLAGVMERRALTNDLSLDSQIAALQSEMESSGRARRDRDRRAETLRERQDELSKSISPLRDRQRLLKAEADRSRTELVFHTHPFVIQNPSIIDAATSFFTELQRRSEAFDRGWGQFGLSCALQSRNDADRAESEIGRAIETLPQEAVFRAIRGSWRARTGQANAESDAAQAYKLDAENWTVNYFAALAYMRLGTIPHLQLAETRLRACRALDAANPIATIALSILNSASTEEKIRKPSYALQLANEAFEIEPSHSSRFALALAQGAHGEFELAARHARQALHDADAHSRSWYEECLQRLEDQKPVRIDWSEFDLWQYSY